MTSTLNTLKSNSGSRKKKLRKGRGIAAGQGASCGFGMRGQKSRSGRPTRPGFEGGQMPIYRKTPKRGFNSLKKINPKSLTLSLVSFNKFKENSLIDNNFLIQEGFLKKKDHKKSIKLIDSIQFKKKLQFKNFKVTPGAKKRIEELGGSTS